MKKHLFLKGRLYSDYPDVINTALGEKMGSAGGFITRPGKDRGCYDICPCACAAGFDIPGAQCFLRFSGEAIRNNDAFRHYGKELLEQSVFYPFAVLNVVGGFELIIPEFRETLENLLSEDIPVLGYLICLEDVKNIQKLFGLSDKFLRSAEEFHGKIENSCNTEIIDTQDYSDEEIREIILQWKREYT